MSGSSIHLILILLVFGASALSWVIGKLREQAAVKRMKDEARRRTDEELRTGRITDAPAEPSRSSELAELRELAARRQQQLQQMRQTQKQTAAQRREDAARGPAPVPIRSTPSQPSPRPGVPGFPGKRPAPASGGPGVPGGASQQPRTRVLDVRVPTKKAKESAPFPVPVPVPETTRVRRLVADTPSTAAGTTQSAAFPGGDDDRRAAPVGFSAILGLRPGTRDPGALRRALVLSEILGPPVASRSNSSQP